MYAPSAPPNDAYLAPGSAASAPVLAQRRHWVSGAFDPFGGENGLATCLYVLFCPCCALGDTAAAGGRSYICSCLLIPWLLPICGPGWFAGDRMALAERHNVQDEIGWCGACLLWIVGCGYCLLCQQIAFLKSIGHYPSHGARGGYTAAPMMAVPVAQPMMMVPAQQQQPGYAAPTAPGYGMYAAPGSAYAAPPSNYNAGYA